MDAGHEEVMTTDVLGDRDLWIQAVAGDGHAFGALFDRHAKAVYNHCFRLTACWSTAEEAVQETFLVAWRRRDEVQLERESALPWLLTIATNVVRNGWRSRLRRFRLTQRVPRPEEIADHADLVAERIDDERRMAEILGLMASLPRNQREALALCVWAEVSYADASQALGITESSVRARVSKAKAALAKSVASVVAATPNSMEDQ